MFLDPHSYETMVTLDGFAPHVHELLIAADRATAYEPIYGDGIHGDVIEVLATVTALRRQEGQGRAIPVDIGLDRDTSDKDPLAVPGHARTRPVVAGLAAAPLATGRWCRRR